MYSFLLLLEMTEHLYTTFSVEHFPFSAQSLGFLQLHPFSDRGLLDLVTFLLCPEIVCHVWHRTVTHFDRIPIEIFIKL